MSDQNTEPGQKLHGLDMNNPEHCWACLKAERDRYKEALEAIRNMELSNSHDIGKIKYTDDLTVSDCEAVRIAQQALEGNK